MAATYIIDARNTVKYIHETTDPGEVFSVSTRLKADRYAVDLLLNSGGTGKVFRLVRFWTDSVQLERTA